MSNGHQDPERPRPQQPRRPQQRPDPDLERAQAADPFSKREAQEEERLLTPDEAARLLGVSKRWLYRHSKELPFARKLSRKCLRFSPRGLRRWQETRRP